MTISESLQHRLERVRAPRVRITYDVEVEDGVEVKEIPFVVGVLCDLAGMPEPPLPKLKERRFVEIDRDNFDRVMEGMKPRLAFKVDNTLCGDGSQLGIELRFGTLEDFHPERVAQQVEPLRKLVEARGRLSDLLNRLDGNDRLDELLRDLLAGGESLKAICHDPAGGSDTETGGSGTETGGGTNGGSGTDGESA
ncbi:type VI secretion system contractile sheath small subunit [Geomonas azotofigens]|uniref:type VI secretion system contractile sheath small subunit n=1 Tax=Geomonas azotofigens TaxID=2843196 RepID=UPI001C10D3FA|nr:type VI secretion system contractile sheath small subunit [Geomonas azotofigens]MBU5613046.1 type VI secretion system contractile sheath small subunit [Geomonas azotofigens]